MTCVFTGRQFQAFLSDPVFWGQGQSYEHLRLMINGVPFGEAEFDRDWDPQDINPDDYIEVVGGFWHGHGFSLPNHQMSYVIEHWLTGDKPEKIAKAVVQPVPTPKFTVEVQQSVPVREKSVVADHPPIARPTFKI